MATASHTSGQLSTGAGAVHGSNPQLSSSHGVMHSTPGVSMQSSRMPMMTGTPGRTVSSSQQLSPSPCVPGEEYGSVLRV